MQIILLDKVVNLGTLGEIVRVKDGYARNFLIPSGRARRATEANKAEFAARRVELERQLPLNWLQHKHKAKSSLVPWSKSRKRLALTVVCLVQSPTTTSPKS